MEAPLLALAQDYLKSKPHYQVLQGDGSQRKIYRIIGPNPATPTLIGVWHQDLEENLAFLLITKKMQSVGLPVATIYAESPDHSCYLLEDLGPTNLAQAADQWAAQGDKNSLIAAYKQIIDLMPLLQGPLTQSLQDYLGDKPMGEEAFKADIAYLKKNFISLFGFEDLFTDALEQEIERDLIQPLNAMEANFFVYRDFQARNFMFHQGKITFIDYQSAMLGNRYYDLASMLYASKSGLTPQDRPTLLRYYFEVCQPEADYATFEENFYLVLVLRRLRSLGSYGYLGYVMKKAGFIESVSPSLKELSNLFVAEPALSQFKELAKLIQAVENRWEMIKRKFTPSA